MNPIPPPFSWFGGKRRVAKVVWQRFGDVKNYVEPFFGSGAVLFGRPHPPRLETINDKDGLVANFWRAVKHDPEAVARWADNPVNENDLHARHIWIVNQLADFVPRLEGDPDFYDAKIAGWWVWGICCWIGSGWCAGNGPWHVENGRLVRGPDSAGIWRQRPQLGDAGRGVNRKRPAMGFDRGVNRKRPVIGRPGIGVNRPSCLLLDWMQSIASRLRRVRVCCGDWRRVCGNTPTIKQGLTAVFLDPPYSHDVRNNNLYREEKTLAEDVRAWAVENGDNPKMRIALCGYEGEHKMPGTWEKYTWESGGGYSNAGNTARRKNRKLERIWFSPHCLTPGGPALFAIGDDR